MYEACAVAANQITQPDKEVPYNLCVHKAYS